MLLYSSAIYPDDIILYSKFDQASDFWEMAAELECDLQGIVGWGRKWLVDLKT